MRPDLGTTGGIEHRSLYAILRDAGVRLGNHESDLQFESTEKSRDILGRWMSFELREHGKRWSHSTFWNRLDGSVWHEVPFAYDPFWGGE